MDTNHQGVGTGSTIDPRDTPVALVFFNRPEMTERVMRVIAEAQPRQLFLIADGPREGNATDAERCAQARELVESMLDWDCEVRRKYSDTNLNCGHGPASGIAWVFNQVDRAILLEDDCIPEPTFFRFCAELLERYKDDERIAQVSGNFHHFGVKGGEGSYFFSRHFHCLGGFATWRRVWQHYDFKIKRWAMLRETPWLGYHVGHEWAATMWHGIFEKAYAADGDADYWDYQWAFNCWTQGAMAIVPNVSLLTNIGYGADATHTLHENAWANLPTEPMPFPLVHPDCVVPDADSDRWFVENYLMYYEPARRPLWYRVRHRLPRKLARAASVLMGG